MGSFFDLSNFAPGAQFLTPEQREAASRAGWFNTAANLFQNSGPQPGPQKGIMQLLGGGMAAYGQGTNDYTNTLAKSYEPMQKMQQGRDLQTALQSNPGIMSQMKMPAGMPSSMISPELVQAYALSEIKKDPVEDAAKVDLMKAQTEAYRGLANQRNNPTSIVKPMPGSVTKLQNEELEGLSTANNLKTDIDALRQQVDDGTLPLGLVNNATNAARNYLGQSTPESQNYATFRANLERMRNDSLRLNKGVQTEGDAQRAWNELINNINDKDVVSKRLEEISTLNDRAANLRKLNIDTLRSQYNQPEMDYSKYDSQGAAVTNAADKKGLPPKHPQRTQNGSEGITLQGDTPEQLPQFTSPTDPAFQSLPSGSKFLDSNGKLRVKH